MYQNIKVLNLSLRLFIPSSFHCKHLVSLLWTVNTVSCIIPFLSVNQDMPFILSILQTTSLGVKPTAVDECWVVSIDQSSGGRQRLASLCSPLGSIQLRFAVCRSSYCWILIPPSNIRPIDFFPEGCFCLHNYWIDFKQRGSSVRPRVHFFCKRNGTKNRPVLSVVFLAYARALQH